MGAHRLTPALAASLVVLLGAGCGDRTETEGAPEVTEATVARVNDGDTLTLRGGAKVRLVQVDADVRGQSQAVARRLDQPDPRPVDPPERRAQVREAALLGRVQPQRPGDMHAEHRVPAQREERDHPARAHRQPHDVPVARHLETVKQAKANARPMSTS